MPNRQSGVPASVMDASERRRRLGAVYALLLRRAAEFDAAGADRQHTGLSAGQEGEQPEDGTAGTVDARPSRTTKVSESCQ